MINEIACCEKFATIQITLLECGSVSLCCLKSETVAKQVRLAGSLYLNLNRCSVHGLHLPLAGWLIVSVLAQFQKKC